MGVLTEVPIDVNPPDAVISLTLEGHLSASYQNGMLQVTATAAGNGLITVVAEHEGYRAVQAKIITTASSAAGNANTGSYSAIVNEIIRLTNEARADYGVGQLAHDTTLDALATVRAQEASEYWSHTRPDGTAFETIFSQYDLHYFSMGENLHMNSLLGAQPAFDAWMASPGHYENVVRSAFTRIGVGVYHGQDGAYYYCQLFVQD